jgi:hypothetical protein
MAVSYTAYRYCSTPHVAEGCMTCAGDERRGGAVFRAPTSSEQGLSCSRRREISEYGTERAEFLVGLLVCYLAPGGQGR